MFAPYVFETSKDGEHGFFNTINKVFLSVFAKKEEFLSNNFYDYQTEECINQQLSFRKTDDANFTIVLGWECNLRCKHCVVLSKLKLPDKKRQDINHESILNFITAYQKSFHYKTSKLCFVGGEPLLYLDDIIKLKEMSPSNFDFFMTTNLTLKLDDKRLKQLDLFKSITVSIDGNEESHNNQRIPLYKTESVFKDIIQNLKAMIKLGMRDKIIVQSALSDDNAKKEKIIDLYETLLSIGISRKKIKIGCIHPTQHKPEPQMSYLDVLAKGEICVKPCCKYRNESLLIDGNKILSDFYDNVELGTIFDTPYEIEKQRNEKCFQKMPILEDANCKKCPVVAYCWGGCSNGSGFVKNNPSKYCGQQTLIDKIINKAKDGSLINLC